MVSIIFEIAKPSTESLVLFANKLDCYAKDFRQTRYLADLNYVHKNEALLHRLS